MAEPNSGCWLWTGDLNWAGYGTVSRNARPKKAHREAWELLVGVIPSGKFLLHKCETRSCVNPAHMFVDTQADNVRDMVAKRRQHRGEIQLRHQGPLYHADVVRKRYRTFKRCSQMAC
jgi:hypothetical protein